MYIFPPRLVMFCSEKVANQNAKSLTIFIYNIYLWKFQEACRERSKDGEQTLAELNSAHHRLQAKCQLVQTGTLNILNCSCQRHIINILLTELSWSLLENLDHGCECRPNTVRSVHMTKVDSSIQTSCSVNKSKIK